MQFYSLFKAKKFFVVEKHKNVDDKFNLAQKQR